MRRCCGNAVPSDIVQDSHDRVFLNCRSVVVRGGTVMTTPIRPASPATGASADIRIACFAPAIHSKMGDGPRPLSLSLWRHGADYRLRARRLRARHEPAGPEEYRSLFSHEETRRLAVPRHAKGSHDDSFSIPFPPQTQHSFPAPPAGRGEDGPVVITMCLATLGRRLYSGV
ncbi:MAG: hypothetical protein FD149_1425 [Rhodospirillaceae bacterium]|nr:MAG: hypothetical protein FD149_1425 [Rhodospirillaceae bacterium]